MGSSQVASVKHERMEYYLNLSHFGGLDALAWASLLVEVSICSRHMDQSHSGSSPLLPV